MPRRRLILVATLLLAAGVWLARPASTQITMENASRIKEGMTLAEVEAILGGPARDELRRETDHYQRMVMTGSEAHFYRSESPFWRQTRSWNIQLWEYPSSTEPGNESRWTSRCCTLLVRIDANDRIVGVLPKRVSSEIEYGLFFVKK